MDLLECLFMKNETPSLSGKDIEVGLSGGLDSVVLLHMLSRLRQQHGFSLRAVHVHHGLSPNADDWAEFCLDYCNRLSIPIRIAHVRVKKEIRVSRQRPAPSVIAYFQTASAIFWR